MRKEHVRKFKKDCHRMGVDEYTNPLKRFSYIMAHHNIRFVYWLRKAEMGDVLGLLQYIRYSRKYGLEISPLAKIDSGIYLGHAYNITVGGGTVIGRNVNLHKGCTIGADFKGKREGSPVIGNDVWCGVNSTIVGKIRIGNDVMIAPGAFVNFDVPDHSVVVGNPGTVYPKSEATKGIILNRV